MEDSDQTPGTKVSSTSATSLEELENAIEIIMAMDRTRLSTDESVFAGYSFSGCHANRILRSQGSSFERIYSAAGVITTFLDSLKAERDGILGSAALLVPLREFVRMHSA